MTSRTVLARLPIAGDALLLRPAVEADLPALVRLLADDQLGAARETAAVAPASHEGFKLRLGDQ